MKSVVSSFLKSCKAREEHPASVRSSAMCTVDIHCHCLAGLDDGPATVLESLELCRQLRGDGITRVIATPHQLGRYEGRVGVNPIRRAVGELNRALFEHQIDLKVYPGADVRVDERIERLLDEGEILTLGDGGRYLLLELPHDTAFDISNLIESLGKRGIFPIISHPERNFALQQNIAMLKSWVRLGAVLQITAGSVCGEFGPEAEDAAWRLLEAGLAGVVATDAHDTTYRKPRMMDAFSRIQSRLGRLAAEPVCIQNPTRILAGLEIITPYIPGSQQS